MNRTLYLLAALGLVVTSVPVHAQHSLPQVETLGPRHPDVPRSANQEQFGVRAFEARIRADLFDQKVAVFPADSVQQLVRDSAAQVLRLFRDHPPVNIDYEAIGSLLLKAGQYDSATTMFRHVLAEMSTGELTPRTRARTQARVLSGIIQQLSRVDAMPTHVTEEFLTQLVDLGPDAVVSQLEAHATLARSAMAHYRLDDVIRHGSAAFALAGQVPFADRQLVLGVFPLMADVLSGQPGGRARIDSLSRQLRVLTVPEPDVAKDFARLTTQYREAVDGMIKHSELLGTPAPSLRTMLWLNVKEARDTVFSLADGTIRVLEFGDRNCTWCMRALPMMERLAQTYPDVTPVFVTKTTGNWAGELVESDAEVAALTEFYLEQGKYTFEIALWAGRKYETEDGGWLPAPSPNVEAYAVRGTPTFAIVDGNGRIRKIIVGGGPRATEQIEATLRLLTQAH